MPRPSRLAAVVAAIVVLSTACGSEPPLPAAEYFPALEAELVRLDRATRDLTDRYAFELDSELEDLLAGVDPEVGASSAGVLEQAAAIAREKMQAIIAAQGEQVEVFTDRAADLAPPQAVAGAHEELVDAFDAWAATGGDTIAQLESALDLAALAEALLSSPFADAQLRVDQACRSLVDNAAAVAVTLTCPGTELELLEVSG